MWQLQKYINTFIKYRSSFYTSKKYTTAVFVDFLYIANCNAKVEPEATMLIAVIVLNNKTLHGIDIAL